MNRSPQNRLINYFLFISCCSVLAVIFFTDLNSKMSLLSTGQFKQSVRQPYYGILPVPGTGSENGYDALGADFSQVFFSALAIRHHNNEYTPQNPSYRDRLGRRPNYPPLTNRLLIPLTFLKYSTALRLHNTLSFLILLGLSTIILKIFNLHVHIWKLWLLDILLYLYTPLGFAHFERGQFDLLTASAFLLIFSTVFLQRSQAITGIAAGFLAAIKWSALPFTGTFCGVFFATSGKKLHWLALLPLLIVILSIILFPTEIKQYWPSLQRYEFMAKPTGVTFMYFMPKLAAKTVQIICAALLMTFLLISTAKNPRIRPELFKQISLPFAMAMFIQGICFGTISYEYRIVSLLGLIPCLLIWLSIVEQVDFRIKVLVTVLFATFMLTAFRVFYFWIWQIPTWQASGMTVVYLCFSLFFLAISFYIILTNCHYEHYATISQ